MASTEGNPNPREINPDDALVTNQTTQQPQIEESVQTQNTHSGSQQYIPWIPVQGAHHPWTYAMPQLIYPGVAMYSGQTSEPISLDASQNPRLASQPGIQFSGHADDPRSFGLRGNPYPTSQPGYVPFPYSVITGRPEPGDPLYTGSGDGPELRLISYQLTGPENYSTWARDFRRALVTKDKEGFLDGTVPVPTDERLAWLWNKCNQLVRTWIGNCVNSEIEAGLPPTEDSRTM